MKASRLNRGGYTIIELMIVVTVSTMIFAAAILTYTQQNTRTRFTESVNTFTQNLQDTLNDVDTGYYPTKNNFKCSANPSGGSPVIEPPDASGGNQQGTNSGCIFLGKALALKPGANSNSYEIYTVVGRQLIAGTDNPVSNLSEAEYTIVPNIFDVKYLSSGVVVKNVKSGGVNGNIVGIVSSSGPGGVEKSGYNTRTELLLRQGGATVDSSSGIDICLEESGGGRTAIVALAGNQSKIAVEIKMDVSC